jgi:hypothetical protein
MTQQTTSADLYDFDTEAMAALNEARRMPPGPRRAEAMKRAGILRNAAVESLFYPKRLASVAFRPQLPGRRDSDPEKFR